MCAQLDQFGQAAFGGGFDFAAVFAQLRRNPGQAQRFVHAGFGFARHFAIVLHAEQAVFAQLQPHLHGARADGHVVVLAAGEVLHGGAEAFGRQRAHIHLQALAAHFGAGLVFAAAQHFLHARIGDEAFERRGRRRAR